MNMLIIETRSAIDLVADFIITASEILCLFPGIVLASDSVGKLDADVLRAQTNLS